MTETARKRRISEASLRNLNRTGKPPQYGTAKALCPIRLSEEVKGLLDQRLEGQPSHINRSSFIEALLRSLLDLPCDLSHNDLLAIADGCVVVEELDGVCVWHDTVENIFVIRNSSGAEFGEFDNKEDAIAAAKALK